MVSTKVEISNGDIIFVKDAQDAITRMEQEQKNFHDILSTMNGE
ncbi:hypothetical protein GCM10023116_22410 [Kistimonas scapharcae]|uniref:Uncharacterized protein n=1 Tax=Kistimonas scapharcae TaxID=1036133 RepID=A0ABP8V3C8_9GAMM